MSSPAVLEKDELLRRRGGFSKKTRSLMPVT